MKLSRRLLIAATLSVVVLVLGAGLALRVQRDFLIEQVDTQLTSARPIASADISASELPDVPKAPFSDFFVAWVRPDGEVSVVLRGGLTRSVPDLDASVFDVGIGNATTAPALASGGDPTFRLMPFVRDPDGALLVAALPLTEVEAAIDRLRAILGAVVLAVVVVMALMVWWVHRLGLRPIAEITHVADAISDGDRAPRARHTSSGTEADRLARAFNVMLDERDLTETSLRRFMADASHELRTPVSAVRGLLEVLADGTIETDEQVADTHRRMARETARMQRLIDDLMFLAQMDRHRPLDLHTVDIVRLVADIAGDASAIHPERHFGLDLPAHRVDAAVDLDRYTQVLVALVDNAVVHTPQQSGIVLRAGAVDGCAVVSVIDDGPGMTPEDAAKVFDRFYRADRSRAREGRSGSGLGLSIARSVIAAHAGTIDLVTAPGEGCAFHVSVPIARGRQRAS